MHVSNLSDSGHVHACGHARDVVSDGLSESRSEQVSAQTSGVYSRLSIIVDFFVFMDYFLNVVCYFLNRMPSWLR